MIAPQFRIANNWKQTTEKNEVELQVLTESPRGNKKEKRAS